MVRIPDFHCRGPGSIPSWGTEILQATRKSQKKEEKKKIKPMYSLHILKLNSKIFHHKFKQVYPFVKRR